MNRYKSTQIIGILGIVGNIFLLIIKAIVGIVSHSQSMIADTANSAIDIFTSLMTLIGNKIASSPKDEDHDFGHGKAEYIFSLLISISMMGISLKILIDSVFSIIDNNKVVFSSSLISVCIITILVKFILYLYTKKVYHQHNNILILSSMKDHKNDCIITTFTTVSILFSLVGINYLDGIVGIGISAWIFITGIKIFIDSYNILMDSSIDKDTKERIISIINGEKLVEKVENIYCTPTGYKYTVVLTIYVDGKMSTAKSHKIANDLEEEIIQTIEKIDQVIIHVNPL